MHHIILYTRCNNDYILQDKRPHGEHKIWIVELFEFSDSSNHM